MGNTVPPLVSVIVPTYNSANVLEACLQSIAAQSYQNIEIIVVDNSSTDKTKAIAAKYTPHVLNKNPERSVQRNYGVQQARGEYIAIIDSDMELTPRVIEAAVEGMTDNPALGEIIIPEESFGQGFWARCKQLERSFYVGVDWMEAARFFKKDVYLQVGGYNENMVSGEDWDLSQRVARLAPLGRIDAYIMHNEGRLKLGRTLKKKYYYAQKFAAYLQANTEIEEVGSQTGVLARYKLFFAKPGRLFKNPLVGVGMLFMKTCELGVGGFGYLMAKRKGA